LSERFLQGDIKGNCIRLDALKHLTYEHFLNILYLLQKGNVLLIILWGDNKVIDELFEDLHCEYLSD